MAKRLIMWLACSNVQSPGCWKPLRSNMRTCLGVARCASMRSCAFFSTNSAYPCVMPAGSIPSFSNCLDCASVAGFSSHANEGSKVCRSKSQILTAYCRGFTNCALRLRIRSSSAATASSRSSATSCSAIGSAPKRSIAPSASCVISVMRLATSSDVAKSAAGRTRLWRPVIHKKSSRRSFSLPVSGERRVPRPTI